MYGLNYNADNFKKACMDNFNSMNVSFIINENDVPIPYSFINTCNCNIDDVDDTHSECDCDDNDARCDCNHVIMTKYSKSEKDYGDCNCHAKNVPICCYDPNCCYYPIKSNQYYNGYHYEGRKIFYCTKATNLIELEKKYFNEWINDSNKAPSNNCKLIYSINPGQGDLIREVVYTHY